MTPSFLLNRDQSFLGISFDYLPDNLIDRSSDIRLPHQTPFGDRRRRRRERDGMYFVCLIGLGLVLLAVRGLHRSRTMRDLVATRENERNAQAFGLSPGQGQAARVRDLGFFASFAGGLLALQQQALGQEIYAPVESIRVLTMVVVGGLGSVPGAILGAIFLQEHRVVQGLGARPSTSSCSSSREPASA